jgi:hypothetical protein
MRISRSIAGPLLAFLIAALAPLAVAASPALADPPTVTPTTTCANAAGALVPCADIGVVAAPAAPAVTVSRPTYNGQTCAGCLPDSGRAASDAVPLYNGQPFVGAVPGNNQAGGLGGTHDAGPVPGAVAGTGTAGGAGSYDGQPLVDCMRTTPRCV